MLGALIIVFREVIEAGIIVGILLAVTKGVPGRGRWIAAGVAAGIAGAALLAVFADEISHALAGVGQELFNASVLAIAVVMLAWHNIWMARHGRELAAQMQEVGAAVAKGSRSLAAVAIVVAVAVLREGSEIVLFLYGLVIAGGASTSGLVAGGLIGLALGCGVSTLTFLGLVRIPGRYLFGVTTVHHVSRGGACRPERRLSPAGRHRDRFGRHDVGYLRDPVGQQFARARVAHAHRLH